MRKIKFFFSKYRPVFLFLFLLIFALEQGYIVYINNQKEVDEQPRFLRMNYTLDFTTSDNLSVKVISTINYNKNGVFWGLFSSERRMKNSFNALFREETHGISMYDLIQNINDVQKHIFIKSLYVIERQCNIDIYDYNIDISITKPVFDKYIQQREDDARFKHLMKSGKRSER